MTESIFALTLTAVKQKDVSTQNILGKQRETVEKLKPTLAAKRAEKEGLMEAARSLELERQELAAALNMSDET